MNELSMFVCLLVGGRLCRVQIVGGEMMVALKNCGEGDVGNGHDMKNGRKEGRKGGRKKKGGRRRRIAVRV